MEYNIYQLIRHYIACETRFSRLSIAAYKEVSGPRCSGKDEVITSIVLRS
jgi:hypothetical protein